MTILFVNELCGFYGGVEQNVYEVAGALQERGHRCYLAYGSKTEQANREYADIFEGVFQYTAVKADNVSQPAYSVKEIIRRVAPDVVYLHKVPMIGPWNTASRPYRVIRMVHDHDLCCPRKHKYFCCSGRACQRPAGWRCWLDAAFLERSQESRLGIGFVNIPAKIREMRENFTLDTLIVGSVAMKQELLQNGCAENKVHILAPAVQTSSMHPTPLPAAPHILYVGQLIHGKGVDLFIQALTRMKGDYTVTIVGDGNARTDLERQARKNGLEARVTFTGWLAHGQLTTLYQEARMVVVPSRWPEPFGMVGLEAMAHARPVVAFNVGGIPDWLQHEVNGLLVPEQDVPAMAQSLEQLLSDSEVASAYGENGFQILQEQFLFPRYVENLEHVLQGIQPSNRGEKQSHEGRNNNFRV